MWNSLRHQSWRNTNLWWIGLGKCCLFNSTGLNNYNPLISSTPFCICLPAEGQLYTVISPVFAIATLLPLFALSNHFLSQEHHVSHSHYTDVRGTPTHLYTELRCFCWIPIKEMCALNCSLGVPSLATIQKGQAVEGCWFAADKHVCPSCSPKLHLSRLYIFKANCFNWHLEQQRTLFCFKVFMCGVSCIGLTKLFLPGATTTAAEKRGGKGRKLLGKAVQFIGR